MKIDMVKFFAFGALKCIGIMIGILFLAFMIGVVTSANKAHAGSNISGIPYEFNNHSYILFTYNNKAVGTQHNPDCANKNHIDTVFREFAKEKKKNQKQLPKGHPPITPELKKQLKNKKPEFKI